MNKAIYGLFDSQEELEAAVSKLQKQGIGQIDVVDESRLENRLKMIPGVAVSQSSIGTLPGGHPILVSPADESINALTTYLKDLDIAEAEARFFSQALKKGGSLIIVDVEDKDDLRQAQQIMRQSNAVHVSHS